MITHYRISIWVRPAEPGSQDILKEDGEGLLEWKIIADPDNEANESEQKRADNFESRTEDTVFFNQDEYSIIVVRTALEFVECTDWYFWSWNDCKRKKPTIWHHLVKPMQ